MDAKKIKNFFKVTDYSNRTAAAMFFVRLVMGAAFLLHGWGKIQAPFNWMPPSAPVPAPLQFLAAISEFGGGAALILGLLTPLAMLGLSITMLVATFMHMVVLKDPFVNLTGGGAFELPLLYFSIAVFFMIAGPGKFSADHKLFGHRR